MKTISLILLLFPIITFAQQRTAYLDGKFIAPVGAKVVITKDGVDDLVLEAKPNGKQLYSVNEFKFPKAYVVGTPYTLTVKNVPKGFTCKIEKGIRGTVGSSPGFIRVGVDYTYDHISRSTDNKTLATFYETQSPVIGGDFSEEGRYVAFVSYAVNLENSKGKNRQIFWRDRKLGVTKLISSAPNGDEGNGDSFAPAISGSGKKVAFESHATNLVLGDGNKLRDVFLWDATTNNIISVAGNEANGESFEPSINEDGNLIAFSSGASNLTAGVTDNATINVYLKNISTGNIKLISADVSTGKGVGGSRPSMALNGSGVAFSSFSSKLVQKDLNGLWDVFVYDIASAKNKRISLGVGGSERNQGTESASRIVEPSISGDGRYVAWATTASNVVSNDSNNLQDVFVTSVYDLSTIRASTNNQSIQSNGDSPIVQGEKIAISNDGSIVAFTTKATNLGVPAGNILLRNLLTNEIIPITKDAGISVSKPTLSRNGGYIVFGAGARIDGRFASTGLFSMFTAYSRCFACNE